MSDSFKTEQQRKEDARRRAEQLELFHTVDVHPHVVELGNDPILRPAVKIGGDFTVSSIPQNGERFTLQIADADGEIVATAELEAGPPAYKNIATAATSRSPSSC
jgi:NAD(P)H-dependent FMN reductase